MHLVASEKDLHWGVALRMGARNGLFAWNQLLFHLTDLHLHQIAECNLGILNSEQIRVYFGDSRA